MAFFAQYKSKPFGKDIRTLMNENNIEPTCKPKCSYQDKSKAYLSKKERLVLSFLISISLGLTICIFGPSDIFLNNINEFRFTWTDFALYCALFCIVVSCVFFAAMALLPKRASLYFMSFAFGLTLMLFLQGNYLNIGLHSLGGDGVGSDTSTVHTVINTIVWSVIIVACIISTSILIRKRKDILFTAISVVMTAIIGMQLVSVTVSALSAKRDPEKDGISYLTYKNIGNVSEDHNIFYFVIDRFDTAFYKEHAKEEAPEIFAELDGFTFYDDMLSLYPRTYPSIAYMLSGTEHDFLDSRLDYFNTAYSTSPLLDALEKNNYSINIYTDDYYGYDDAACMGSRVENAEKSHGYTVHNKIGLAFDMLRLSLYRYMPFIAKDAVGNISTPDFNKYTVFDIQSEKYTTDMKDLHDYISENGFATCQSSGNFSFIHMSGCHLPNIYGKDFAYATDDEKDDVTVSLIQSFKIINQYIRYLKDNGLYENATIIITGDHGWHGGSDSEVPLLRPHITALFFKPLGASDKPLEVSSAPIAQADILPSILKSEGIEYTEDLGKTIFDIDENDIRERRYVWQSLMTINGKIDYKLYEYKIVGKANDLSNWSITDSYFIGDIYD